MKVRKVTRYIVNIGGQERVYGDVKDAKRAALEEKVVEFLLENEFGRSEAYIVVRAIRDHRTELLALFDEPLEPEDETQEPSE